MKCARAIYCGVIAKKGYGKRLMFLLILIQICLIGVYYKSVSHFTIKVSKPTEPIIYYNTNNSINLENDLLLSRITELESNVDELRSFLLEMKNKQSDLSRFQKLKKAFRYGTDKHFDEKNNDDYYFAQRVEQARKIPDQEVKYISKETLNEDANLKYDFSETNFDQDNFYGDNLKENRFLESENVDNYDVLENDNTGEEEEYEDDGSKIIKCRKKPKNLKGLQLITFETLPEIIPYDTIEKQNPFISDGGQYTPLDCEPRWKVAIIIPYRNRERHLRIFLYFMHPILQRQLIHYRIYIINQAGDEKFNRAKLLNVGFSEALKDENFDCFVFHDVDHILINDQALYACPPSPRHLSHSVDKFGWGLPYENMFGGVSQLTQEQFREVNGFANSYWGWGAEDDDMMIRIESKGYTIIRYPREIAVYMTIPHLRDKGNENNPIKDDKLLQALPKMATDGLSSLNYTVVSKYIHKLYTNITVDIGVCGNDCNPPMKDFKFNRLFKIRDRNFLERLVQLKQQLQEAGIEIPNRHMLPNHISQPQIQLSQNERRENTYQQPIYNQQYQQRQFLEQS